MIGIYPCDRGMPNDVSARGWHEFAVGASGIACCRYCGTGGVRPTVVVTVNGRVDQAAVDRIKEAVRQATDDESPTKSA